MIYLGYFLFVIWLNFVWERLSLFLLAGAGHLRKERKFDNKLLYGGVVFTF